jgi:hypothetical protein
VFIVVRQAQAGHWGVRDVRGAERPLAECGWPRGKGLAENLAGLQATGLLSDAYLRCRLEDALPNTGRVCVSVSGRSDLGHVT